MHRKDQLRTRRLTANTNTITLFMAWRDDIQGPRHHHLVDYALDGESLFLFLFVCLETGSHYVALVSLELLFVDQADLELTEILLPLLASVRIKGVHWHTQKEGLAESSTRWLSPFMSSAESVGNSSH